MANNKGNKGVIMILIIVLIASAFLYFSDQEQEATVVLCESGGCSDEQTTIGYEQALISRSTAVASAICNEVKDAEAYIDADRNYDEFYLFNRDGATTNEAFNEEIGAHTGIAYQLFVWDEEEGRYSYDSEEVTLEYAESSSFNLE